MPIFPWIKLQRIKSTAAISVLNPRTLQYKEGQSSIQSVRRAKVFQANFRRFIPNRELFRKRDFWAFEGEKSWAEIARIEGAGGAVEEGEIGGLALERGEGGQNV